MRRARVLASNDGTGQRVVLAVVHSTALLRSDFAWFLTIRGGVGVDITVVSATVRGLRPSASDVDVLLRSRRPLLAGTY